MFDYDQCKFLPEVYDVNVPYKVIHEHYTEGITSETERHLNLIKYGNSLIEIPSPSFISLCLTEAINPFYCIMVFYIVLWYYQDYAGYSIFTFAIAFITIVGSCWSTKKNLENIQKMALYTCQINL